MRRAGILLLGLLCGCITKALWSGQAITPRPPRRAGEVECELALGTPALRSRTLAFAVTPPGKNAPKRMRTEVGRGRTCLLLRSPYAFSFAGSDILEGRTPLEPGHVTVNFAQTRTKNGTRRDPALLRIEGQTPSAFVSRIERCGEPAERHPLDEVDDPDLRIQLGHGMDALVALAAGARSADAVGWYGVEGPGAWQDAIGEACEKGSLAPLDPYRVIARLWRNGQASCFRLRLEDVVLASHMSFSRVSYTWEGLWIAALELPTGPATASAGIPSQLCYTEYKEHGKSYGGVVWRALLTPAALAADFGVAGLDDWLLAQSDDVSAPREKKR